jgi:hypothetical protein
VSWAAPQPNAGRAPCYSLLTLDLNGVSSSCDASGVCEGPSLGSDMLTRSCAPPGRAGLVVSTALYLCCCCCCVLLGLCACRQQARGGGLGVVHWMRPAVFD